MQTLAHALALALGEPSTAWAGESETDHTAEPDRPDIVNGNLTVPRGGWQVEVGVNVDLTQEGHRPLPLGVPTVLRIGITDSFEIRAFDGETAEWVAPGGEIEPRQGFGGKLRLIDEDVKRWTPSLGLQPMVQLGLRKGLLPSMELTVIVSQPFGRLVLLDINAGAEYEFGVPQNEAFGGLVAGSLGVQVHPRLLLYDEVYLVGQPALPNSLRWGTDGGFIVSVTRYFAFDVAARVERYGSRLGVAVLSGVTALLVPPCHRATRATTKRPMCRTKAAA